MAKRPGVTYLPAHQTLGMSKSFLRFDRAHVVPCRWLRGRGVCLHPHALELLTDRFRLYLTGELAKYLREHRDELLAAVKETLGRVAPS